MLPSESYERERPFFSIITVSLNAEKVIGATLQSVTDQQGVEGLVEHWVIDGASTDGTLDVVRQYSHVRYLSEPDKGVSDAFNKGIQLATGEYIIFLNCDDIFCDNQVLADLYRFAVDHKLPDWIVGGWYARRLDGAVDFVRPKPPVAGWNLFLGPRICHQAVVLRLAAPKVIGDYDLDFKIAMDYDSWAKLYQAGYKMTKFKRPLIIYAGEGLSTRNDAVAARDHNAVKARLRDTRLKRIVGALYDRLKRNLKPYPTRQA
jgi:glycosyltransferase involved in cell wall biosynthesis